MTIPSAVTLGPTRHPPGWCTRTFGGSSMVTLLRDATRGSPHLSRVPYDGGLPHPEREALNHSSGQQRGREEAEGALENARGHSGGVVRDPSQGHYERIPGAVQRLTAGSRETS